jgi:glycosyltransferase involved in cell wall biosynthesis
VLAQAQIAVVVPAYNEALQIARTLRTIPSFVDRVIVVDDGSTDGTSAVASAAGDRRIQLVRHPRNRGVGAALRTGYSHALAAGADVVAVMAGDGQMHPDDLSALLWPVLRGEVDYAKGDRLSHPEALARMPLSRYVGNHMLSALTRAVTGAAIRDSQCGYTAFSRRALERVPLHRLWDGYGYPNDLLGWLLARGASVCDVVVRPVYGVERSGIRLHHALLVVPFVLARVLARRIEAWSSGRATSAENAQRFLPAMQRALPAEPE